MNGNIRKEFEEYLEEYDLYTKSCGGISKNSIMRTVVAYLLEQGTSAISDSQSEDDQQRPSDGSKREALAIKGFSPKGINPPLDSAPKGDSGVPPKLFVQGEIAISKQPSDDAKKKALDDLKEIQEAYIDLRGNDSFDRVFVINKITAAIIYLKSDNSASRHSQQKKAIEMLEQLVRELNKVEVAFNLREVATCIEDALVYLKSNNSEEKSTISKQPSDDAKKKALAIQEIQKLVREIQETTTKPGDNLDRTRTRLQDILVLLKSDNSKKNAKSSEKE